MQNTESAPSPTSSRGRLIAFEGIDGAGKTTQVQMAQKALQTRGFDVVVLHEPSRGEHGMRLRAYLSAPERPSPIDEMKLFLADRQDDVERNVKPALARGDIILMDRYYISSMAYQGARGLDVQMIRDENEKIAPRPDVTLVFRLPVTDAQARIVAGRPEGANQFERRSYQDKVYEVFEKIALPGLVRVDATKGPELLHLDVMREIEKVL